MLARFLFFWQAGNPHFNQVVFCRRLQRISIIKGKKIWIPQSSRVTADTIVLRMSQLLMLAGFICFLSLNSMLKSSVFFKSLTRTSSKKCKKVHAIIKSNYDRYNRLVRGSSVMLARFFSFVLAGNPYLKQVVFWGSLE